MIQKTSQNKNDSLEMIRNIMKLNRMSIGELTKIWSKTFDIPPPIRTKDYMMQHISYKMQELVYGGLDASNRRKLVEEGNKQEKSDAKKKYSPAVGTVIIKEHKGQIYEVRAVENGFSFDGRFYRSLSEVSSKITGNKTNGLLFFKVGRYHE